VRQSLSLFMAISGAFTAIQFVESLIFKGASSGQHTSKKGSALFSIFAASWCIGVNCVWVMHFLAMSAGATHTHRSCGARALVCVPARHPVASHACMRGRWQRRLHRQ
jgi:hypothetical protein